VCCPCCPWERILDPLYCLICAPCLCIARIKKKNKVADNKQQQQQQQQPSDGKAPPVNEIERMNRAMYETPADPNTIIPPVASSSAK